MGCGEAVTDAGFGQKQARLRRIDLDLLAKAADEHAKILGIVAVARTPDFPKNVLVGKQTPSMAGQQMQQIVLARRELDRLSS